MSKLVRQSRVLPEKGETKVYQTADGAPYVICHSTSTTDEAFCNPTSPAFENCNVSDRDSYCRRTNESLHLHWNPRKSSFGKVLLWIIRLFDRWLFEWWEHLPMMVWTEVVPVTFKRALTKNGWNLFLKLHSWQLGKSTGLHPSQSLEYHAMTTLLSTSPLMAWTPHRMRFFLQELYISAPNDPPEPHRITRAKEGWYIRASSNNNNNTTTTTTSNNKGVLFWIYGGAYLAGDVRGNSSIADWLALQTQMDVFVPQFRLAPEATLFEVLQDICQAYLYLQQQLHDTNKPIYLVGVSSGAAIATRLTQLIAKAGRKEPLDVPDSMVPLVQQLRQAAGAVLLAPYVDYTQLYEDERKGSFLHYAQHDLIVNQAVQEYGLPYLKDFIPNLDDTGETNQQARQRQSPIYQSFQDLPPLCIVSSEHEAVYDQTCELVHRARQQGVDVTIGVWKYMCHVFCVLHGFLPEGQLAMEFVVDWLIKQEQQQQQQQQEAKK